MKLKVLELYAGTRSIGKAFEEKGHEVFSVEWDEQHENIDLYADMRTVTSKQILEEFGKPDIIWASPPCESWSTASAMIKGNACWKQERGDSLFEPQTPLSKFTIRDNQDFKNHVYDQKKAFITRVNGELTIFNTIQIIERYKPKYHIIENPAFGRIWDYIKEVIGFKITYENLTYYNNYDYPIKKPTKFGSNINLNLSKEQKRSEIRWQDVHGYNNRSNIPEKLVEDIFKKVKHKIELEGKEDQNGLFLALVKESKTNKVNNQSTIQNDQRSISQRKC